MPIWERLAARPMQHYKEMFTGYEGGGRRERRVERSNSVAAWRREMVGRIMAANNPPPPEGAGSSPVPQRPEGLGRNTSNWQIGIAP